MSRRTALDMVWLPPLLIAVGVFLFSALVFSYGIKFLESRKFSRIKHSQIFARLRFFLALLLMAIPIYIFFKLTAYKGEKTLGETIALVVLLIAGIWILSEFVLEFLLGNFFYKHLGIRVPGILSDVVKGIFYITAVVVVLHIFLHVDLKPFLTTSAIFTVIVGLAFQDTLGNVIAGLALHFASPYQVGDWIRFGDLEGKILRVEWRSTLILTRSNDTLVVPHISMAKNEIYNYSVPSPIHAREIKIPMDASFPPEQVVRVLLQVALESPGVLQTPKPSAYILEFQEFKILYGLWIWIDNFEELPKTLRILKQRIWYALRRVNFPASLPQKQDISLIPPEPAPRRDLFSFLSRMKLFQELPPEKLRMLCGSLKHLIYADQEMIIREGEKSEDFYLVYHGKAEAMKNNMAFYEFSPGDFFGEIALITGEPRRASVQAKGEVEILLLTKEILVPYLEEFPPFLAELSEIVAARIKRLPPDELPPDIMKKSTSDQTFGAYVLQRIKEFFLGGVEDTS